MSTELKSNEFQCAKCGGVFEKEWSDEEAEFEYQVKFGDLPPVLLQDPCLVCDPCYKEMFPDAE